MSPELLVVVGALVAAVPGVYGVVTSRRLATSVSHQRDTELAVATGDLDLRKMAETMDSLESANARMGRELNDETERCDRLENEVRDLHRRLLAVSDVLAVARREDAVGHREDAAAKRRETVVSDREDAATEREENGG